MSELTPSINRIVSKTADALEAFNDNILNTGTISKKEVKDVVKHLTKVIPKLEPIKGPLSVTAIRRQAEAQNVQQMDKNVKNRMLTAVISLQRFEKSVIHDVGMQAGLWSLLRIARQRLKGRPVRRKRSKVEKPQKTDETR